MRFGLILLGLIIAVSLIGSLIPQNNEAMYYVRNYPDTAQLILNLQLNRVFTSWYFILLVVLLCVNLIFCSILRIRRMPETEALPESFTPAERFGKGDRELLEADLSSRGYRAERNGNLVRYTGNQIGVYGSFLLHLGILLTTVFFALGLSVPKITDQTCLPGESVRLDDGTEIKVDSFSIENETGMLDYASEIDIILPDGRSSGKKRVSVNHPVSMGDYKVYQQTYGTIGRISVSDQKGHTDTFTVEPEDFLSADGENGIWYDDLYPGYEQDETGKLTLITSTSGHYENPVYVFVLRNQGNSEQMLAFPGDTVEVGEYTFLFEAPVEYPGLRIKKAPAVINLFLLLSVILMTVGLFLIFFMPQVNVVISDDGYTVIGRNESLRLHIRHLLNKEEITNA